MRKLLFGISILGFGISALTPAAALAQDAAEVRRMFEAGRFQQVVQAAGDAPEANVLYTAAQSHQKLGASDEARAAYTQLASRGEDDPWHFIGLSGQQLLDGQTDAALESAQQAVALASDLAEAHYQLGLVQAKREDWRAGAEAFDRASQPSPALAYGHYYTGLLHYRVGPRHHDASLRDLVGSAGIGLRLATPFALLRVDYAKTVWGLKESSGRWTFGIGHAF